MGLPVQATGVRARLLAAGRWSVLLSLFSIPVNKPAVSIFMFFALLGCLFGSDLRARFDTARRQPVVVGAAIWFGVLALSALHAALSSPSSSGHWGDLGVYKALLYPLVMAMLLTEQDWRDRGLFAFGIAAFLVLLLSWGEFIGVVPVMQEADALEAFRYTVFNDYSQQGLQTMMLGSLCAAFALTADSLRLRRLLWGVALLALANVIFLLQSRTSYLVIVPLVLYWGWRASAERLGNVRGATIGVALVAVLGVTAMMTPRVHERIDAAGKDISEYVDAHQATSLGIRLELWQRTLPIIAAAPVFGHGLAQWVQQYQEQTRALPNFEQFRMGHPHQEALSVIAEEGIAGLLVLVALLVLLGRRILALARPQRDFFACLLLIYLTAGLANCLLIDFVHRHAFLMLLACFPLPARLPGEQP